MVANRWIDSLYYVGADGAMLADTVTPDGYRVGADGKWIPQGGAAAETSSGKAGTFDWSSLGRAYQEKIQDEIRQGITNYYDEGSRGPGNQFTLLYFDEDDVPEMAVWYDYKTQDGNLYGYKDGKAFLIGGMGGYLSYVPRKNYMEAGDYGEKIAGGYLYGGRFERIEGGKLKTVAEYSMLEPADRDALPEYRINNETMSEQAYESAMESLRNAAGGRLIELEGAFLTRENLSKLGSNPKNFISN